MLCHTHINHRFLLNNFRHHIMCQRILSGMKMLLLLSCWIIAGITAEGPPTRHYRVKNSSLCLHVGKPPGYLPPTTWLFNEKVIVVNEDISPNYTDKVVYNPKNLSLCINQLTERDSGIYKVTIIVKFVQRTESHRLIVEETVPTPALWMSVMRSNLSAGFCNITVNCSIWDDWVWSVCDGDSCRTPQRSFRRVNITISADNRFIVCSGNNHVSTSNVSESINATCTYIYCSVNRKPASGGSATSCA
ncbi:uncharacterized protein [Enoplosus armatus]|uniref:uncharacterized protein n=1 Tax=Enoplosus armatus TaxID=215367 RepID=UPI003995C922